MPKTYDTELAGWLAANVETFSDLFDGAGLLAGVLEEAGDDFRYVAANANVAARYGLAPSQLPGRTGRSLQTSEPMVRRILDQIDRCHREGPGRDELTRVVGGVEQNYLMMSIAAPSSPGGARREAFLSVDISALRSAEVEAARQQELAEVALDAAAMGVWEYDIAADQLRCDPRAAALIGDPNFPIPLAAFMRLVHPDDADDVAKAQAAAERGERGGYYRIEHRVLAPLGGVRWIETTGRVIFGAEAVATRAVGTVRDVGEQVAARERQAVLTAELNHRVKNSLSLVLAIVDQAQRTSRSSRDLVHRIRHRLLALAKTHDLLAARTWQAVDVQEMLADELSPYGFGDTDRIRIDGGSLMVGPKGAVSLGMLFHELATNAARHGALSRDAGRLDVTWSTEPGPAGEEMTLTWRESGGPPVAEQRRRGFGTVMIERGLMRDYPGGVQLSFPPEGVRCELRLPLLRLRSS